MSFQFISAILRGQWFLHRQWAEAHLPLALSILQHSPIATSNIERTGNAETERPFVVDPKTMQRHEFMIYDPRQDRVVPNPNIPQNSVGILPINGPVTKYNGDCGEPGAIARNSWLIDMERRANIGSVVFSVDTPGGEARAASSMVSTIDKFSKPILSHVNGMSASLGMWYISGTDEVYLSNELDEVGSVGSYVTLMDFTGWFEKQGVKVKEIYAPQSTDKNKDYRDALNGDTSAIETDLARHVDAFISYVKNSRGDIAAKNIDAWKSGKMFYAEDAKSVGLIDGVRSLEQVISKAAWLAKRSN